MSLVAVGTAVGTWTPPTAAARRRILRRARTIAVVGASANPARASNFVLSYLRSSSTDYEVWPVTPNEEEILKPVCFVFDFAPTRALRQLSEYGIGLSPSEPNPENAVKDLVSFLPVLAYDGANMTQIDAGGILDIAMAGTSATLLARKW